MSKKFLAILAMSLFAGPLTVNAATIDFSGVQGNQGSPLVLPEATITNLTGPTVLVGPGAANAVDGFCFLNFGSCEADGEILFSSAVQNLFFDIDGWDAGDFVSISAFNGITLLGSINAISNGTLDFSGFGSITRLFFDDSSVSAGVGYSTFNYDSSAVPEPASLALLGAGLAAMAIRRRKQ